MRILIILFLCSVHFGYSPSISSYTGGQTTPFFEGRADSPKYNSSSRTLENVFVYAEGPVTRRPGTRYISQIPGSIIDVPEGDYNWQFWFPESSTARTGLRVIYGYNGVVITAGGDANDLAGNLWGLPAIGHPFIAGQTVEFRGTHNAAFDTTHTVHASTTANEVVITDADDWSSLTFTGDERLTLDVDMTPLDTIFTTSRMATDGTYVYIPVYEEGTYSSCIMRWDIATVTLDTTWKVNPTAGWGAGLNAGKSAIITDDNTNIIIVTETEIVKATIADGTVLWHVQSHGGGTYAPSTIVDNTLYITPSSFDIKKYDISDGSFLGAIEGTIHVITDIFGDSGNNIFVGCKEWGPASPIGGTPAERDINIVIWNTATNTVIKRLQITAEREGPYFADVYNNKIYITYKRNDGNNVMKLDLEGNILGYANVPFQIVSHYWRFDNKLCVVKNNALEVGDYNSVCIIDAETMTYEGEMLNLGYIYSDTSLWTKNHPISLVNIDGTYQDAQQFLTGSDTVNITDADETVRLIPFEYSTDDAYVLGFGDGYMGFYRTIE